MVSYFGEGALYHAIYCITVSRVSYIPASVSLHFLLPGVLYSMGVRSALAFFVRTIDTAAGFSNQNPPLALVARPGRRLYRPPNAFRTIYTAAGLSNQNPPFSLVARPGRRLYRLHNASARGSRARGGNRDQRVYGGRPDHLM